MGNYKLTNGQLQNSGQLQKTPLTLITLGFLRVVFSEEGVGWGGGASI